METPSTPEVGIHLKDSQASGKQFSILAGLMYFVFLLITAMSAVQRDFGGLFFWAALPVVLQAIGRYVSYITTEDYLILFPNRMEYPRHRDKPDIVIWSDVEAVR